MVRKLPVILALLLAMLLQGCAMFSSHYDAIRLENLTRMKAVHMKLFDDWTAGSARSWDRAEVSRYCESGDLTFREAYEYAKSKDDKDNTGQKAVKILWEEFSANCGMLLKRDKPFGAAYVEQTRPQIEQNYDYAIAGEEMRVK